MAIEGTTAPLPRKRTGRRSCRERALVSRVPYELHIAGPSLALEGRWCQSACLPKSRRFALRVRAWTATRMASQTTGQLLTTRGSSMMLFVVAFASRCFAPRCAPAAPTSVRAAQAKSSVVFAADALALQFAPSAYAAGWARARRAARHAGRRVHTPQAPPAACGSHARWRMAQAMDPAQLRPDATLHTVVSAFRAARPQLLAAVNAVAARSQPETREARASPRAPASRAQPAAAALEHAVIVVSDGGGSDSDFVAEAPARRKPSFGGARAGAPARVDVAPSTTHAACPVCSWCARG